MMSKVILSALVVLLASVAISEGMALRSLGVELHCRCIQTESRPIGRHIEKVELIPANSHCEETEIIATLKKTGQEVCLDPHARWVTRVIERIIENSKRR
ncbi:interleukin-8-like isoform X1 [Phyllopteryx taeniolatus]|uniref:interleukin-8-like isoform X1 n=1 Tax=Phyllopteryx taeniolatus TaxID=161469 RepID=UPI002AD2F682|nr:interleukin-8-like isoform X1 [Phyllopteryx taeniolatus]